MIAKVVNRKRLDDFSSIRAEDGGEFAVKAFLLHGGTSAL